ncbi:hypothetical protein HK405_000937, partial [Cladochytrium tenue]
TEDFHVLGSCLQCLLQVQQILQDDTAFPGMQGFVRQMAYKLWRFLEPQAYAEMNEEVCRLLWRLLEATPSSGFVVEETVLRLLSCGAVGERIANFRRFGVLWLVSEQNGQHQACRRLARALFVVFDCIRSDHPAIRGAAEAWMKKYAATSFVSILQPLVDILSHHDIVFVDASWTVSGKEMRGLAYRRDFNMTQVVYGFQTLRALLEYLGRPFVQAAFVTTLRAHALDSREYEWTAA